MTDVSIRLQLGTACLAIVLAAGTLAMAPARVQDPDGCGQTERGWLSMSSPAGGHRPGVYIKMKRTGIIAESKRLGTKKTRNGYDTFTKRLPMGSDACIRATMKHRGKHYISISKYLDC